jgi:hypothetical protein
MAVSTSVFWDVKPYSLTERYQRSGKPWCLHFLLPWWMPPRLWSWRWKNTVFPHVISQVLEDWNSPKYCQISQRHQGWLRLIHAIIFLEVSYFPLHKLYQRISPGPRLCVVFRNMVIFYGEELLAPSPTPKLEDHPCRLSATGKAWTGLIWLRIGTGGGLL